MHVWFAMQTLRKEYLIIKSMLNLLKIDYVSLSWALTQIRDWTYVVGKELYLNWGLW